MNLFQNRNFKPMLLSETKYPFDSKDYLYEMKFDGYRALIFVSPTSFHIQSRRGNDLTNKFPELKEIQKLVTKPTVLDGEIVLFSNGVPNFSLLQKRFHSKMKDQEPVSFVCFDYLYEGKDLTQYPLVKRKQLLAKLPNTNLFLKTFYVEEKGKLLFDQIKKKGLEGIVAKEKNSIYEINTRTYAWIKIKNIQMADFYIGGFSEKPDSYVFSLYLGEYNNNQFQYIGKVFTSKKNELYKKLKKEKRNKNPFSNFKENIYYVKPNYLCEIEFLKRNQNGRLRHASFRGIKT